MYGLSRMALDDILQQEQVSLATTCQMYARVAQVCAEDGNDALGQAIATIVRLRIVSYLQILDEVAATWKLDMDLAHLQENYDRSESVYGRWWSKADKLRFDYLLREVMDKVLAYEDEVEQ